MQIGNIKLKNPVITAPMAGITDKAFREILKSMGAGMVFSEMVSDKALTYGNKNTLEILDIAEDAYPVCVQIFGSEPEIMAKAAKIVESKGADLIDINMGCPAPKIVKNGEGCALMKNPVLAGRIVAQVAASVQVPVTVKLRKGWDESQVNVREVAKAAQESGAAAVTIHGRTRDQFYSGEADWEIISEVKSIMKVPVIGNGDIWHSQDGAEMIKKTGCDGVMIARGMLGNPWLIAETIRVLAGEGTAVLPGIHERISLAQAHLARAVELKGEDQGVRQMRKHLAWYIKGLREATRIRTEINSITSFCELDCLLSDYAQRLILMEQGGTRQWEI